MRYYYNFENKVEDIFNMCLTIEVKYKDIPEKEVNVDILNYISNKEAWFFEHNFEKVPLKVVEPLLFHYLTDDNDYEVDVEKHLTFGKDGDPDWLADSVGYFKALA